MSTPHTQRSSLLDTSHSHILPGVALFPPPHSRVRVTLPRWDRCLPESLHLRIGSRAIDRSALVITPRFALDTSEHRMSVPLDLSLWGLFCGSLGDPRRIFCCVAQADYPTRLPHERDGLIRLWISRWGISASLRLRTHWTLSRIRSCREQLAVYPLKYSLVGVERKSVGQPPFCWLNARAAKGACNPAVRVILVLFHADPATALARMRPTVLPVSYQYHTQGIGKILIAYLDALAALLLVRHGDRLTRLCRRSTL